MTGQILICGMKAPCETFALLASDSQAERFGVTVTPGGQGEGLWGSQIKYVNSRISLGL